MVLKLYLAGVPKVPMGRDEVEGAARLRAGGALCSPGLSLSLSLLPSPHQLKQLYFVCSLFLCSESCWEAYFLAVYKSLGNI